MTTHKTPLDMHVALNGIRAIYCEEIGQASSFTWRHFKYEVHKRLLPVLKNNIGSLSKEHAAIFNQAIDRLENNRATWEETYFIFATIICEHVTNNDDEMYHIYGVAPNQFGKMLILHTKEALQRYQNKVAEREASNTTQSNTLGDSTMENNNTFCGFVTVGDTINVSLEGFDFTVKVEHDAETNPHTMTSAGDCFDLTCNEYKEENAKHLARWDSDEWFYSGLVVSAFFNGVLLDNCIASLWGLETNILGENLYLNEEAHKLCNEAVELAKKARQNMLEKLEPLTPCKNVLVLCDYDNDTPPLYCVPSDTPQDKLAELTKQYCDSCDMLECKCNPESLKWETCEAVNLAERETNAPTFNSVAEMKQEFKLFADKSDRWGEATAHMFELCFELVEQGHPVPTHWEFSQGAQSGRGEEPSYGYENCKPELLVQWGNILNRYIGLLDSMGKSY